MKTNKLRVVPDTNIILASIFPFSRYRKILDALDNGLLNFYLYQEILLEYEEKLTSKAGVETSRNSLKSLVTAPKAVSIKQWFRLNLISRDPDDNKFVDCAFACNAPFIVTNTKPFDILQY